MVSQIVIFSAVLALACAQSYEHKQPLPAILSHKQALTQDGNFQYSFSADNGLQQGETISPDGSRKGAYSYVDPNGKTITVTYTADKNGFQVHGDHLPKPVQPVAPAPAAPQQSYYQPQPQQSYQPAPQAYRPAPQQSYQPAPQAYRPAPQQSYQPAPQQSYNLGPALFAPAAAVPRQYQQAAPVRTQASYVPQQQQDYDDQGVVDPNKPHNFGDGYSFNFAG